MPLDVAVPSVGAEASTGSRDRYRIVSTQQEFESLWDAVRTIGGALPDLTAIADMLHFPLLPTSPSRSLIAGVQRVRATVQHKAPADRQLPEPDDFVCTLERQLLAHIGSLAAGARRIGVLATGGLDSAVIAALVREATGVPPILVAIRGGLSSKEEIKLQAVLASALASPLVTVDEIPKFELDPLIRINGGSDFPAGGVFTHVWDRAAEVASDHQIDLLFTGEGGNEVFSPGLSAAQDLLRMRKWGCSVATLGRCRDIDDAGAVNAVVTAYRRTSLPRAASAKPPYADWIAQYTAQSDSAIRRRRQQVRTMRQSGLTYREADAAIWLERCELTSARDSTGAIPFVSPIEEIGTDLVASLASPSTAWPSNPVRTGCQDKHALRLVGRKYLPLEITEARKIGIADQNAVLFRDFELPSLMDALRPGAEWLGLRLDDRYLHPLSLPTTSAYGWGRLLTFCVWALNATA